MTPLIVIPARQMSQGRPCKNREAWPAFLDCVVGMASWHEQPRFAVVTDDPFIWEEAIGLRRFWLHMNGEHHVSVVVRHALSLSEPPLGPIVVAQLSSPTKDRHAYIRYALFLLESRPEVTSVISVVPWEGEPPSKACTLTPDGYLSIPASPEPRQLQPQHYRRDGTVYAVRRQYAEQGDLYGPRPIPLLIDPKDSVTLD